MKEYNWDEWFGHHAEGAILAPDFSMLYELQAVFGRINNDSFFIQFEISKEKCLSIKGLLKFVLHVSQVSKGSETGRVFHLLLETLKLSSHSSFAGQVGLFIRSQCLLLPLSFKAACGQIWMLSSRFHNVIFDKFGFDFNRIGVMIMFCPSDKHVIAVLSAQKALHFGFFKQDQLITFSWTLLHPYSYEQDSMQICPPLQLLLNLALQATSMIGYTISSSELILQSRNKWVWKAAIIIFRSKNERDFTF